MRIAILGSGAWGTALAVHAAGVHQVRLWSRDPAQADALVRDRENRRYLPGVTLSPPIEPVSDLPDTLDWLSAPRGLLVIATSVAGLRPILQQVSQTATELPAILWLCKGLERDSGLLPHQVVAQVLGQVRCGVLSGPSFAQEVAAGLPVALTAAAAQAEVCGLAIEAFHHGAARIYSSDDVVGVEVGGALKNVMAIAAGICDGLRLGHNARAALITRGLAEIARFGVALGARPETFTGLAGLGDLVLTCTGDLSRNRRVGLGLAAGQSLSQIVQELGHVAEGVACAGVVEARARTLGVDLPIVSAVLTVLEGRGSAREALQSLLAREPRREL
jgi:glycerol-3-phosphate dehydrogenase (NAD(P)+)